MDHFLGRNDEQMQCRGILHIVEPGDTLYKIGKKYGVPVSRVMYANPYVNVYNLQVGDEICVPVMMPRIPKGEGCVSGREGWAVPTQEPAPPMQGGRMGGQMPPMEGNRMGGQTPPMEGNRMGGQTPPMQGGRMGGQTPPMEGNRMGGQVLPMDGDNMDGMQGMAESGRGNQMAQLEGSMGNQVMPSEGGMGNQVMPSESGMGNRMTQPESGTEMRGAHYLGGACVPAENAGSCVKVPGAMPWENQTVSESMVEEYLSGAPGQN